MFVYYFLFIQYVLTPQVSFPRCIDVFIGNKEARKELSQRANAKSRPRKWFFAELILNPLVLGSLVMVGRPVWEWCWWMGGVGCGSGGSGLGLLSDVGKGATDSVAQAVCWRITKTSLYGAVYIANHGKTSKPWGQINEFNCLSDQEHNGLFDHFVSEGQKVTKLDCFQVPKGGMRQMVVFLYKMGPCWSFLDYFWINP